MIADAKRGDIDVSATAYGQAFFSGISTPFGDVPGLGADLLTASPLLGRDSIAALLTQARAAGGGLLLLTRTSNPGADDVQGLQLGDGRTVSEAIAALVDELGRAAVGAGGLSDVGAVTGATAPGHLERLRELMPNAVMLLPGLGPQGGDGRALAPAFAPGPAGGLGARLTRDRLRPRAQWWRTSHGGRETRHGGCASCSGTCTPDALLRHRDLVRGAPGDARCGSKPGAVTVMPVVQGRSAVTV